MRYSRTRLKSSRFVTLITSLILSALFILSTFYKVNQLKCPLNNAREGDSMLNLPDYAKNVATAIRSFVKTFPFHTSRVDRQGIIKIYDWVWSGKEWGQLQVFQICLTTHSSMDRMHGISELIQHWNGPLSLAMYITSPEEWVGLNLVIHYFQRCSQPFRDYVSIHVAIPTQIKNWEMNWRKIHKQNITQFLQSFLQPATCHTHPKVVMSQIGELLRPDDKFMMNYPQNHLRNIAKMACGPNWVFSTDIDIIPVFNASKLLSDFVASKDARSCENCAFVIPTFELDEQIPYPETKAEIVAIWKNKSSNPFHFNIFKQGHAATNYSNWAKKDLDQGPVKISYDVVMNGTQLYEPFYISLNTIPNFSERFIGYGFTRNSQVQHALSEGWRFKVLSPIFSIHWGIQRMKTLLGPGNDLNIRRKQTSDNGVIYNLFKKELDFIKKLRTRNKLTTKKPNPPSPSLKPNISSP